MVFTHSLPLVPAPASATVGEGRMPVTTATRVLGTSATTAQLIEAVERRTGIRLSRSDERAAEIELRLDPAVAAPEGYTLTVDDRVVIAGADEAGLFYGMQTLLQLLREDESGWGILRADVQDAPRFERRGVMLDVARHFFGVDAVKKFIDTTSALKFNHLHLHLSDDQGWRVHIDSWPLLTELSSSTSAGGDAGGFYTKDDYREIVAYAASRHMVVIPEIDLPGHTHAIGVAYPELVEAPVMNDSLVTESARLGQALPVAGETYLGWGVGHSSVRIHEERTYDFVRDVIRELAEMTPGPYIHIGGDESLGTPQADFDLFAERATAIVVEAGKTPIAWHEMGSAAQIAEGTVGQYWGMTTPSGTHAEEAAHFVERGGALIMSAADVTYLDMKYTADFPLGLTWAAVIDVRTAYQWEPTAILDVPDTAILGIEAPLWSETTRTFRDVEQMVFPRAAAQAEVAWSPKEGPERTWESFRARLGSLAPLWKAEGVDFHAAPEITWSER
ncbi:MULTISPECIES: family 20 glycosylhydrolase [unclassified Microbacterium]|uniref:family 20 glycosylhydrolase n=1 Tax=unclassified Microbacterium TaxID=2609290 RepID=UPI000EA89BCC|nr:MULTISPECIES: family 20 glycosylhydrolase [unclassified Microbacterium]MBT2485154.1 beta-N-acetylhexosaminidase [Microbacterium sp. ISL-108]RKN67991.1 beta-N-acetylhexosaminidase [Microbacterium sp. CGR2]